ncbi:hypothetical protein EHH44_00395 [Mycolicibacter terrae]|uniref:Uncharacterized protein n=2 Tax=Mycolicibacter TaxID=1073531 RepID=A0A1A2NM85_MYCSD|nr:MULTISPECIES: hypothetical protein [Mycolicibacter]OBH16184.1 hypothetical protein A5694_07570 [Mycolicibacter sinensis]OBI29376.1 hypothetical protein A5710_21745 [Mycolicibacter sinensis]RRR48540.1 hypothetical protein EHH44_00395 [Mycolicibacter terrae]
MKLDLALRELHRSEMSLARRFRRVGERHKADHDVFHLCADLAGWSDDHVRRLAQAGHSHGLRLAESSPRPGRVLSSLREMTSVVLGRRPEPGVLLLADLRSLYLHAAAVSVDWELVAQGAQAARDSGLLEMAAQCHPETVRQMDWANTMLKELAPQVLMS